LTTRKEKVYPNNGQRITAPKKNGGRSENTNIVQLINFVGYKQFGVPKPPLLVAANRYAQAFNNHRTKHNH